jgi:hypothetical protein
MQKGDTWTMGAAVERAYAQEVVKRGGVVMPLCAFVGNSGFTGAPMMVTAKGWRVAPDFLVVRHGGALWAEVKAKSQPAYYFKRRRWEHGLDWYLVKHYRDVQRESGSPVWIIVYEEHSPTSAEAAPEWDERHLTPYRCCEESGVWLYARLDAVIEAGERRKTWPDGQGGEHGHGGLLWPRDIMHQVRGSQ